jgi:hypothetical protein
MRQTVKLPLFTIYSLIQDMEKMANDPKTAKQYKNLLSAMDILKESFMPLIDELKNSIIMPEIDATVDTADLDSERNEDNSIDWEQRRYELAKAAMQGRVSALDKNYNFDAVMPTIAKHSIKMADILIEELRKDNNVTLMRKTENSNSFRNKIQSTKNSTPVKSEETIMEIQSHEPKRHVENTTKGMRVSFPDGTIVWHRSAVDTFIESLRKIGFERVSKLGIYHSNYNLVGKKERPPKPYTIWQHKDKEEGWYIYTNIENAQKVADLQKISDVYHLGLKIEEGKPK